MNTPLPIRVTLLPRTSPGRLKVDLHWSASRRKGRGYLSGGQSQPVGLEGGNFVFELPVPPQTDLQHVRPIIFIGPTGRWADRQQAVETELIPVRNEGTAPLDLGLHPVPAHEIVSDAEPRPPENKVARIFIAALWLACAVGAWCNERRPASTRDAPDLRSVVRRHCLSFACLAAAVVESASVDIHLTSWLRASALEHRLYFERRGLQQLATLLAVAGVATFGWISQRRIRSPARSLAGLCLGIFAAYSLTGLFSLHQLDQILAVQVGPVPLGQAAKLLMAVIAAFALWPRRYDPPDPVESS